MARLLDAVQLWIDAGIICANESTCQLVIYPICPFIRYEQSLCMLSEAQHLDYDMLEELKDIMDDEFLDLLRAFLSDSKMRINSLRSAYADNRQDNISAIAHSFKGSSGNIGAHALSELCKELEKFAKEGLTADVSELIDGLEKEFLSVSAELLDVVSAHE